MNDAEKQRNAVNDMKLSLCITTYNRPELTIKAFEKVYNDPRIDEIVIVDDCSGMDNFEKLMQLIALKFGQSELGKITISRNQTNIGMSRNKARAVDLAKNGWCILFDSDNVLGVDYLDAFYKMLDGEDPLANIIYCPDFARPMFDYRSLSDKAFTAFMVKHEIGKNNALNMALNTCNCIVHRQSYLDAYNYNPKHIASDTIWFNYNWMLRGGNFYFVPGMQYEHLVHDGSGFMQDAAGNMVRAEEVRKLIMQL